MGQYSNKKEGNEMTGIDILLEEHQSADADKGAADAGAKA